MIDLLGIVDYGVGWAVVAGIYAVLPLGPVAFTHLTLPTILLV